MDHNRLVSLTESDLLKTGVYTIDHINFFELDDCNVQVYIATIS